MTVPSKITDHADRAKAATLSQYKDSARLKETIGIHAAGLQEHENLGHDMMEKRRLADAEGVQLDIIGKIVGWAREGLSDDEYRKVLDIGIQVNQTDGEAYVAADIISQIVGVPVHYRWCGNLHCSFEWEVSTPSSADTLALVARVLPLILPCGVSAHAVEGTEDAFRFDSGPGFDQGKLGRLVAQIQ